MLGKLLLAGCLCFFSSATTTNNLKENLNDFRPKSPIRTPFLSSAPRERHRNMIEKQAISAVRVEDNLIHPQIPDKDCVLPGSLRKVPLSATEYDLPICVGYGPGFEPPFLDGTRSWWEGSAGARPSRLWEIYSCPAQNPTEFLKNPLRCLIDEDSGLIATFIEAFTDPDFILDIVKSIAAPLTAELIWAVTPFSLFERMISTICSISSTVESVLNSVGSVVGSVQDIAGKVKGIVGTVSNVANKLKFWRRLDESNTTAALETCVSDCSTEGFGCWRPFPTAQGLCVNQTAFQSSEISIPLLIYLYSLLLSVQIDGVSTQVDGVGDLVQNVNYTVNLVNDYFDPTMAPTTRPTRNPTSPPTANPTDVPTSNPTDVPTSNPTGVPTSNPTDVPTSNPTSLPTNNPSKNPTSSPSYLPTEAPSTVRRKLGDISEGDVQSLADQIKDLAKEVGEGNLETFTKTLVSIFDTPELREFISKYLDDASSSLDELSLDPETPLHKLVQMVVVQSFDKEQNRLDIEKVRQLKEATRRLDIIDIFGPLQGQKGQGTLIMEQRQAEAIKRNNEERARRQNADTWNPTRGEVNGHVSLQSCPAAATDGIADQACDWVNNAIQTVKKTIADFISNLFEKGLNLAANVGQGICLSSAISLATAMVSFMDPFAPNGPPLPRLALGALVDIFQAFMVQKMFGSCNGYCKPADFDADPFCCLPSKSPAFTVTESLPDPSKVYLTGGCQDDFVSELQMIAGAIALVDPLLGAASDAVLPVINTPIAIARGMLGLLNGLLEDLASVCDFLSPDGMYIEATYQNTKYLIENTICRPTNSSYQSQSGYGCDGLDNNCDFVVDECGEDTTYPEFLVIDARSNDVWYKSSSEVFSFYNANVRAMDDCDQSLIPIAGSIMGVCAASSLTYSVADNCGNSNSLTVNFKLDTSDPVISCSITKTNLGLLSDDEPCNELNEGWCDKRFVNVGLHYDIDDDCGIETVSMKVYSDELASPSDAYFVKSGDKYDLIVNEDKVFDGTCPLCVDGQLPDGRVYEVQITATDYSGKSKTHICPLIRVRGESPEQQAQVPVDSGYRVLVSAHDSTLLPVCTATSHDVTISRRGFGCDGLDNNCDTHIDDCQEDRFPPEFSLSTTATPSTWFKSLTDARKYANQVVSASDDCYAVTSMIQALTGVCDDTMVPFTVSDACGNNNSMSLPIKLDLEPPTIECAIQVPDIGWQRDGPRRNRFQCGVGDSEPCESDYVDVGFSYFFNDDCGVASATFEIYSDEMTKADDVFFYYSANTNFHHLIINQKEVYDDKPKCDKCIGIQQPDGRVYEVVITVEDVAGNVVSHKCPLITVRHDKAPMEVVDSGLRLLVTKTSRILNPLSTAYPTSTPTSLPSNRPSLKPTLSPSLSPSLLPTLSPTSGPIPPSEPPTTSPSSSSSPSPSFSPVPPPTERPIFFFGLRRPTKAPSEV